MRDLGPVLSPDQLVVTHVDVLQLGVEAEGGVHSPDVVVLELEPLYAGVEGDGQHLQPRTRTRHWTTLHLLFESSFHFVSNALHDA